MSTLKTNRIENNAGTAGFDVATIPDGGGFSMRNKLINGGFDIWQRGTSFTTSGLVYSADRWATWNGGTGCTTTRVLGVNSRYMLNAAGVGGNTLFQLVQRIEGQNIWRNKNGNVTLSLRIQSDIVKDMDIWCAYPTTTDTWDSSRTIFYRKTISLQIGSNDIKEVVALPNDVDKGLMVVLDVSAHTSGNIAFDTIQLEEGSVATPFEQRPIGMELALCQRYYWRTSTYPYYYLAPKDLRTPTASYSTITFPTTMRSTPDVTFGTVAGTPIFGHASASGAFVRTTTEVPTTTGINNITADAEL